MKNLILFGIFTCLLATSCISEFDDATNPVYDQSIENRNLTCIEGCNDMLVNCRNGSGQIGESQADFYEYLLCRCPLGSFNPNNDCTWMGNNNNDPEDLSCSELWNIWADWQDECYVGYTLCIKSCDYPGDRPDGPRKDCDGDGIPNGQDPTPGC